MPKTPEEEQADEVNRARLRDKGAKTKLRRGLVMEGRTL